MGHIQYIPDSLKESTKEKRAKGVCRKVSAQANIPGKWMYIWKIRFTKGPSNSMPNCNHEEADTWIVCTACITIRFANKNWHSVILAGGFYDLCKIQPRTEIQVAFGVGKTIDF